MVTRYVDKDFGDELGKCMHFCLICGRFLMKRDVPILTRYDSTVLWAFWKFPENTDCNSLFFFFFMAALLCYVPVTTAQQKWCSLEIFKTHIHNYWHTSLQHTQLSILRILETKVHISFIFPQVANMPKKIAASHSLIGFVMQDCFPKS